MRLGTRNHAAVRAGELVVRAALDVHVEGVDLLAERERTTARRSSATRLGSLRHMDCSGPARLCSTLLVLSKHLVTLTKCLLKTLAGSKPPLRPI